MFPAQRGLYGHRSTMNQFVKPEHQLMNFDSFPFTNANLIKLNSEDKSPLMRQYSLSEEFFDHELSSKEDGSVNNMSIKKPLSKAERRAEHNAIERARRENLNSKFQSLAQALPNLMNYRRPSKSQIVEKALEWVKQNILREERYRYQILQLQRENKKLLSELISAQQEVPQEAAPAPIPRHSKSTPITNNNSSSSLNTKLNINTSLANASINLNTTAVPMALDTSPIPNMYSTDFINNNNGWSNNYYMMNTVPQATSYHSSSNNEQMMIQDFALRSDDEDEEDNASSGNEDDIDYHSTPRNLSSSYNEHGTPSPLQKQQYIIHHQQQHHIMAPELYSLGTFSTSETQFEPTLINNSWNRHHSKCSSLSGSEIEHGNCRLNTATSLQMQS